MNFKKTCLFGSFMAPLALLTTGCGNKAAESPENARTTYLPRHETFRGWCENQKQLTSAERHTVRALLSLAAGLDCSAAEVWLRERAALSLPGKDIVDLGPLSSLTHLRGLRLSYNRIRDARPLAHLAQLETLSLDGNELESLEGVETLAKLETLELNDNRIHALTPLRGLSSLKVLLLRNNKVTSAAPLADLPRLQQVDLRENPLVHKTCPRQISQCSL